MIDRSAVRRIIDQYKRHGWTLRRVLLSDEVDLSEPIDAITPERADLNGLWFSRRSHPKSEAWELRHLSGAPFALIVVIDDGTDAATTAQLLRDTEIRMIKAAV